MRLPAKEIEFRQNSKKYISRIGAVLISKYENKEKLTGGRIGDYLFQVRETKTRFIIEDLFSENELKLKGLSRFLTNK